eukprot:TRINITY_DN70587_c0_g1_i1.p1 TRINITY_DN70587_c0_g1~~TRINITY_DN70587_c0_g1_i1.p1  ORF type:complete len:642 (+),score=199.60 TRINITY_DN70587_c0_g1_i1:113-2038(+)
MAREGEVISMRGRRDRDDDEEPGTPGQRAGYAGAYADAPRTGGDGQLVVSGAARNRDAQRRTGSALSRSSRGSAGMRNRTPAIHQDVVAYRPDSDDDFFDSDTSYEHRRRAESRQTCHIISGRTAVLLAIVMTGAAVAPLLTNDSLVLFGDHVPLSAGSLVSWVRGDPDEVTLRRDTVTKRFGYVYNDRLLLGASEENTPARAAGLSRFIGRQITHLNGIAVGSVQEFRDVESRVGDVIQLRFAPTKFVPGAQVRAVSRIHFQSGKVIEAGMVGEVIKVPGDTEGSIAEVKIGGTLWDALPGQVEVVEVSYAKLAIGMPVKTKLRLTFQSGKVLMPGLEGTVTKVPGDYDGSVAEVRVSGLRFDAMPGQIEPVGDASQKAGMATVATEEVVQLLEALGHQNYLPKLLAYGIDRLDFLAAAEEHDASAVGVKPLHWRRITSEAKRRAALSSRGRAGLQRLLDTLGETSLMPKLISWGFDRVDLLARTGEQDGDALGVKQDRWQRILREARRRVNETQTQTQGEPVSPFDKELSPEADKVRRMLSEIGMKQYWRRVQAFGLDDMTRLSKAPNLTSSMEVNWNVWRAIQEEARRRERGEHGKLNPEVERENMLEYFDVLVKRFERDEFKMLRKPTPAPPRPFRR